MPVDPSHLVALDRLLDGARWWGAQLETTYRVLALTIEPSPQRGLGPDEADRRLQVLLFPAGHIKASLRVQGPDPTVETFTVEQLVDVVGAFDGPIITGPCVGVAEPGMQQWGSQPSLEGRSDTVDGRANRLVVEVVAQQRALGLYVSFDDLEVRSASGETLAIDGLRH